MIRFQIFTQVGLRISMGMLFFYAGYSKIINPEWTAAGYLNNAKGFTGFYAWLSSPQILPIINIVNEYALLLLGISLILGLFIRISAPLGVLLMFLYYLALGFPFPNEHAFIVDEHIIYIFALLYLASNNAGTILGIDKLIQSKSISCTNLFRKYFR